MLSLYLRREGSDMRVRVTLLPRDQSMALFLSVLSCWTIKLFIRRPRIQQCLSPTNNTRLLLVQEKIQIALCCSEVGAPCCKDKACSRVFTQKQQTDALNSSGAAPGLRVVACLNPCIPQWESSTEVQTGTMNHKSPPDL